MHRLFQTCLSFTVAAGLVAAASAGLARTAQAEDNPMYRSWARHNTGTSITVRNESESMGQKTVTTIVTTLVEKNAERIVLENKMTMEVGGNTLEMPAQNMEIPAAMPEMPETEELKDAPKPEIRESSESISIAGKEYTAKLVESTVDAGGGTVRSKSWTSDEVPGMMLKSVTTVEGQFPATNTMEVTRIDIK